MAKVQEVVAPPFMRPKPRMLPIQPGTPHQNTWCPMETCDGAAVGSSLAAEGAFRAHLLVWISSKLASKASCLASKA